MANLTQLRLALREIFDESLREVDAGAAIRNAIRLTASRLHVCETTFKLTPGRPLLAVAMGKAAVPMAVSLQEVLGDRLQAGVITAPKLGAEKLRKLWQFFEGGHPLPNEASLEAAQAALALMERANQERALVIFLVSGGGSAMMEAPVTDEITLEDLRSVNQTLVNSSASIAEINSVRRTFSAIKGGRLAARAPNCRQVTLIVSDVPERREGFVASGPSLAPGIDDPSPAKVIARLNLRAQLPLSVTGLVYKPLPRESPRVARRAHFVLLDNNSAINAAFAEALGRRTQVAQATDIRDQPIDVGCEKLLETLKSLHNETAENSGLHTCLVSGGEFACPVRGNGIGGRNLETALRLAILAEQKRDQIGEFVALCAGTDGIDGNSPAAGAIIDSTTIERARRIGLEPNDFLQRSDAYSFFVALGDVITTGPTGTNVRDLRILLKACQHPERYQGINSELKLKARSGRRSGNNTASRSTHA